MIRACAVLPEPPAPADDVLARPGGAGRTTDAADVRRGVGFAVGFKNLMYAEGYDDASVARCRLLDGVATVTCAAAEVGQGFVTLVQQFARTILGVEQVVVMPADTSIGSAGSTSASRQTMMSGGAVEQVCLAVRTQLLAHVAQVHGCSPWELRLEDGRITSVGDAGVAVDVAVADAAPGIELDATEEFHHVLTHPLDHDGQGDAHVTFACAAHKAVVDVDPDLGLVRVVHLGTAQDVGKVLNPVQALGQVEGGSAQGVGLAVMEEIVVDGGRMRNPSFTDYLLPTALDAPTLDVTFVEVPEPGAPFGAKGVGEPPTLSSTPAVVAALRAATGRPLVRVPVRPGDVTGTG